MFDIYPCRVVVTSCDKLVYYYNADPKNALMASYCLIAESASCLVTEQRKIETVVLINGEGEELICLLADRLKWSKGNMPDVLRLDVSDDPVVASSEIRNAISVSFHLSLCAG